MASHSSDEKKPIYKKWWFWLIIIIVIAGIGGAGANNQGTDTTTSSQEVSNSSNESVANDTSTEQENIRVTLEQYNQVQDGMTYDEVVSIFGGKENSSSESEIAGIKSEVKTWSGNGTFSVVSIGFTDGQVSSKSQTGLE